MFELAENHPELAMPHNAIDFGKTGKKNPMFLKSYSREDRDIVERKLIAMKHAIINIYDNGSKQEKSLIDDAFITAAQWESPSRFTARMTSKFANTFKLIGGKRVASTSEGINRFENLDAHGGNEKIARIQAGQTTESLLGEAMAGNVMPKILRSTPLFGIAAGIYQLIKESRADVKVEEMFQGSTKRRSIDDIYSGKNEKWKEKLPSDLKDDKDEIAESTVINPTYLALDAIFNKYFIDLTVVGYISAFSKRGLLGSIGSIDLNNGGYSTSISAAKTAGESQSLAEEIKQTEEKERQEKQDKLAEQQASSLSSLGRALADRKDKESKSRKSGIIEDDKKEKSEFNLSKFGIGAAASLLFALIPKETLASVGTWIKENSDKILTPIWEGIKGIFGTVVSKISDFAKENPLSAVTIGSALITAMMPGTVGRLIGGVLTGIGSKLGFVGTLGGILFGGVLYNFISSWVNNKENGGGFGDFIGEFLIGSKGSIDNAFGKAATYAWAGFNIGKHFGPYGMLLGLIGGGLMGGILGWLGVDGIGKIFDNLTGGLFQEDNEAHKERQKVVKASLAKAEEEGRTLDAEWWMLGVDKYEVTAEEKKLLDDTKTTEEEKKKIMEHVRLRNAENQRRQLDFSAVHRVMQDAADSANAELYGDDDSGDDGGNIDYNSFGAVPVKVEKQVKEDAEKKASAEKNPNFAAGDSPAKLAEAGKAAATQQQQQQQPSTGQEQTNQSSSSSGGNGLNFVENMISSALKAAIGLGSGVMNLFGGLMDRGRGIWNGPMTYDVSAVSADELGALSEQFEGKGDSSTVAYDTYGGTSYGRYQFASKKGAVKEFLEWANKHGGPEGKKVYETMYQACDGNWNNLDTGSKTGKPVEAWKALAKSGILKPLEAKYAKKFYFEKDLSQLASGPKKLVMASRALQQALFSAAVQHGPNTGTSSKGAPRIFNEAYQEGMNPSQFAQAIYEGRKNATKSNQYRTALHNRYDRELSMVLATIQNEEKSYGKLANSGRGTKGKEWAGYPNISSDLMSQWKVGEGEQLVWPAQSTVINSPAGMRNVSKGSSQHMGIDIKAGTGEPVVSALGGTVLGTNRNYGTVVVQHPGGWITRYLHLSNFGVKAGEAVGPGQVIGRAGGTGEGGAPNAYDPHLHFEMIKDGQVADPEAVFYNYDKAGGNSAYKMHRYASDIVQSRHLQAKLAGRYGDSSFTYDPNSAGSGGISLDPNSGGPEVSGSVGSRDMLGSLNNNVRGFIDLQQSSKKNTGEEIVKKLDEMKAATIAAATVAQKQVSAPVIAVSSPSEGAVDSGSGGTGQLSLGDPSIDHLIDNLFSSIGNMLSNFNVAHTNLAITTT